MKLTSTNYKRAISINKRVVVEIFGSIYSYLILIGTLVLLVVNCVCDFIEIKDFKMPPNLWDSFFRGDIQLLT